MGLGAAYLSYLFSRAGPTSRAGRYSKKVLSFSPFAGLAALLIWFGGLSSIVGGSTIDLELYIVIVLLLISLGMMLRDRLNFRMALRNFARRKTSMAIVILGLMIGTAMISGSLVTHDTFTELFTRGAYYGYGFADEVVYARNITGAGFLYFSANTSRGLSSQLTINPQASPFLLGSTPEIISTMSLSNANSGNVQSPATLIGTFSNASQTEERKSEMGMSRAVGMRRGQLTKMFLFEGSLYSTGAAFVGVFVGIAIAYVIVCIFATIISRSFSVNLSQVLASFTFTSGSCSPLSLKDCSSPT